MNEQDKAAAQTQALATPGTAPANGRHKGDLEASLATLLTAGTALAAAVLFLGLAGYLRNDSARTLDFRTFNPTEHSSVFSVFRDAMKLEGAGIMQLGVVLLILTPVTRMLSRSWRSSTNAIGCMLSSR